MNCLYCGKPISKDMRKGTKYCSRDCSLKHYRAIKADNNKRYCVICGKQLFGRDRKVCGGKCRFMYASRRRREYKSAYISKTDKYTESMVKKRPDEDIEEAVRNARENKMTYGQYTAMKYLEQMRGRK